MRTKPIIAGAVLIAILLLVGIVFIGTRSSPVPITVRHVKSVQSGNQFTETFEITNHTARSYWVTPVSVEVRNGPVWKTCSDFGSQFFPIDDLGPHGSESRTFHMTNLATGSPLRLRLLGGKGLAGLDTFFMRLNSRFRQGQKNVPLNPFDNTITVFGKDTQIVSDEFVEPKPKQ